MVGAYTSGKGAWRMKTVNFEVVGKIKGKARPRVTKTGHAYTPDSTVEYEQLVKLAYKSQCRSVFFGNIEGSAEKQPIEVHIRAMYAIPKSYTKGRRLAAVHNMLLPTKKPDADNIAKIICDALNGVAYADDAQIVKMRVDKVYTSGAERVAVWISEVEGLNEEF